MAENVAGNGVRFTAGSIHKLRPQPSVAVCRLAVSCESLIGAELYGERTAALPSVDSAHLPTAQDRIGESIPFHSRRNRQIVLAVDHEILRDVKIRDATLAAGLAEGPCRWDAV